MQNLAFIFPGQGAQVVGMGKDFSKSYSVARETFEEADEILERHLSRIIFEGPESDLTKTENCQVGIYVASIAILRVLKKQFPELTPEVCAGLSLGEYTALTASEMISIADCLPLVAARGHYMSEACEATKGTMAVILGMSAEQAEEMVSQLNLTNDLWVANFNCPGQVVISGTYKGVEKGSEAAKERGAKRVLPLQVHGAFHSGLMNLAQDKLAQVVQNTQIKESKIQLVMNVPGDYVTELSQIRENLIKQVTHSVRWEQGIHAMQNRGVSHYVEIGPGKTLSGMNKRIGVLGKTQNIQKVEDLQSLEEVIVHG